MFDSRFAKVPRVQWPSGLASEERPVLLCDVPAQVVVRPERRGLVDERGLVVLDLEAVDHVTAGVLVQSSASMSA